MENEIEQEEHIEEQQQSQKHSQMLENEEIEKNFNLNGKEDQIVLHSENTDILETAGIKINNVNEDKQDILYTNLNDKEQQDQIQIGNILSDESFERKFMTLKEKITQNKKSLTKLINISNVKSIIPSPRLSSVKQQSLSPPSSSSNTKKINELFSMIAPLENSNSIPSLPIQGINQHQHYNQHTFVQNYAPISEHHTLSTVKSTIGPRLITNKNTLDILHKGIANKIEPIISNSFSANFVTAGDGNINNQYGCSKKKGNEHNKNSISKTSINLDLGKCFEKRKNKEEIYKKDYFLNKLDSFGDKLFGQNNGNESMNTARKNKIYKRKILTPATLRESRQSTSDFYDIHKMKNKKEAPMKFNRLKLFV